MNESEATLVVAALAAAWPRDWAFVDPYTKDIYRQRVEAMPRAEAATAAVNALIDNEPRLPSVAQLRDEYRRHHDRFAPPALPEPELSPEERQRNVDRMRVLSDHLARREGHSEDLYTCPHPGCAAIRDLSVPGAGQD